MKNIAAFFCILTMFCTVQAAGKIRSMDYYKALKSCHSGTHLPTIRELAERSKTMGALGILEINQVDPYDVPEGYHKISGITQDGQKDEFYFNHTGYKRPNRDLTRYQLWSASVELEYRGAANVLNVDDGDIYTSTLDYSYLLTAECFADR